MTNEDVRTETEGWLERLRQSALARVLGMLGLVMTLQIPIGMIRGAVSEREMRRHEAVAEVTRTWGGRQIVAGPFLVIPYLRRVETGSGGTREVLETVEERYVLPQTLDVQGALATETRRRGIFDVPLYVAKLSLAGTFRLPPRTDFPPDTAEVRWEQASLALALGDPRAIRDDVVLQWQGQRLDDVRPGLANLDLYQAGLHARAPIAAAHPAAEPLSFALDVSLAGSDGVSILPAGSETVVRLRAPWPDPRFDGAHLPLTRTVTEAGFEASWRVLYLARNFPSSWTRGSVAQRDLDGSLLGVTLLSPVDAYRTTERAVKYQLLFLGLTFLTILLVELIGGLRVHPIQYLLIGCALCLFYLLLLSLAEHLGFEPAYAIASVAIVALVGAYARSVLRGGARAAAVPAVVAALYGYLFVLLQIQDYALLAGALGLLGILAGVMYLTRNVDWYALPFRSPHPTGS